LMQEKKEQHSPEFHPLFLDWHFSWLHPFYLERGCFLFCFIFVAISLRIQELSSLTLTWDSPICLPSQMQNNCWYPIDRCARFAVFLSFTSLLKVYISPGFYVSRPAEGSRSPGNTVCAAKFIHCVTRMGVIYALPFLLHPCLLRLCQVGCLKIYICGVWGVAPPLQ
jgi:hypothetical protein